MLTKTMPIDEFFFTFLQFGRYSFSIHCFNKPIAHICWHAPSNSMGLEKELTLACK